MINTRAQRKLLHTWIKSFIVKQRPVKIDRKDGPTGYPSQVLAAIKSLDSSGSTLRDARSSVKHYEVPSAPDILRRLKYTR